MEHDEEWNNFIYKVQEVSKLIKDLSSSNDEKVQRAITSSDRYLSETDRNGIEQLRVVNDRTIINSKVFKEENILTNPNQMNPAVFMRHMELDAKQRANDKKVAKEKAETFKTRAIKAFRRKDYETALSCYNKAIDHRKDSCPLYTGRSSVLIKLGKYEEVIKDCERALKLNSDSFKANLYYTKALSMTNDDKYYETRENMMEKFPKYGRLIEHFLNNETSDMLEEEKMQEHDNTILFK